MQNGVFLHCRGVHVKILSVTTCVLVRDLDRALPFYRDRLGLTLAVETEDWVLFAEGIALSPAGEVAADDDLRMNGMVLALEVDDVRGAFAEMTGAGVPFLIAPTDTDGGLIASLRDPDGNVIEIAQRTQSPSHVG